MTDEEYYDEGGEEDSPELIYTEDGTEYEVVDEDLGNRLDAVESYLQGGGQPQQQEQYPDGVVVPAEAADQILEAEAAEEYEEELTDEVDRIVDVIESHEERQLSNAELERVIVHTAAGRDPSELVDQIVDMSDPEQRRDWMAERMRGE